MIPRIAGVVVLYNPDSTVAENISMFCNSIRKLYLVDNSPNPSLTLADTVRKCCNEVEYIHLPENEGIATALNIAACKAVEEGYEWLLTMDQDSRASINMIQNLLQVCKVVNKDAVGIIAPRYVQQTDAFQSKTSGLEEVDVAITSGNLLNLQAFAKVGPFREDFFIDYVDHEYCLRLNSNSYKVIINNDVVLDHKLGDSKAHNILFSTLIVSHHNYLRRYYITRNRLAVLKEFKYLFPKYYRNERTNNLRELVKIIFFEDDKIMKIKSIIKGYKDFKENRFGKYRK